MWNKLYVSPCECCRRTVRPAKPLGRTGAFSPASVVAGQIAAQLVLILCCSSALASLGPVQALRPAITNGLIRWWPNLFDARDEITGQEGVVMGVLPPVKSGADDETEFDRHTGWVQLQPAITNEVFTLSFWLRIRPNQYSPDLGLLGQQSSEGEWLFQSVRGTPHFGIGRHHVEKPNQTEAVHLEPGVWHHVVIARRADGTGVIWVDGIRSIDGRVPHDWPGSSRWLTVGNVLRGGEEQFNGGLRDLCAFDRVLTDEEARALHLAGLPKRPARNTSARLAATRQSVPIEVSTNVVAGPAQAWTHRRFTTEDGLPGNIVKAVLQARNGYLWVGTEEGLARFDGRQFRVFTSDNTPAMKAIGQTVWSLAEDADGTIWAGIFGGLLRIRDLEVAAFTNGLPQRFVLQAQPAGDGSVWVAGFNAFVPRGPCWLRRYHPASGTSSAEVAVPGHVRRLVVVTNGVWLATEQPQQMHFWDGRAATTTVVGTVDDAPLTVRLGSSSTLPPGSEVRAWIDGVHGSNGWAQVRLANDGSVFHWLWDSRNWRPWAARWNGPTAADAWLGVSYDLARLRGAQLESVDFTAQAPGPEIACLCANREGGVWFGTEEDGLHFVQERLVRVFTTQDGLSGNDVRSVCAAPDGGLWATTAGGLSRRFAGEWTFHGKGPLRGVTCDRQGSPWFGIADRSHYALQRDRASSGQTSVMSGLEWQDPNSLRFAGDGSLWVVCEGGLTWLKPGRLRQTTTCWTPDTASPEPASGRYAVGKELPEMFPLGLVEDRDGSMWMGSLGKGLFHVTGGRVEAFTREDGLAGNHCAPVYCDDSGALWIVTEGGLSRRAGGRFQNLSEKEGLPKDVLLDLIEDGLGNFWISGKRGIHRIARRELEDCFAGRLNRVRYLTLGARDGLLTPECSSLHYPTMARTPDGHIWVATRNGLATFDPRRVKLDTQPLPAVIEQLVVNRNEFPLVHLTGTHSPAQSGTDGGIRLPPGSGQQLEFHFTATSLLGADRVKFCHRLDGYDSEWSPETDLRLAFYTNLRPGAYRFRVKAANAHGIWSDQETVLSFLIRPYFWETKTCYILSAVVVLAAVVALHRQRVQALGRLQTLSHQQDLANERARIAADMHDDLGAALTQIAILGEVAKRQLTDPSQASSVLDRISQSAREVTSRMSDLVWATNPRHDSLDNLSAHLREQAARMLQDAPVRSHLAFPSSVPVAHLSATVRRNVLLVMKESITNALRHAHPSEIGLTFEVDSTGFRLTIEDNGCGFDPPLQRSSGNGLVNMRRRITDIGGTYELLSKPGTGTRIKFWVPLPHQDGRRAQQHVGCNNSNAIHNGAHRSKGRRLKAQRDGEPISRPRRARSSAAGWR